MRLPPGSQESAADAARDGGVWAAARAFWQTPGVLETTLLVVVAGVVVCIALRLRRFVRDAAARRDVTEYLLGAEQALHGDAKGASRRLAATLAKDPENHHARLLYAKALADLGQPEAAHKQHLILESAFGVASAANRVAMGKALLAAGEPFAAAAALQAATVVAPQRQDAWALLAQAHLRGGAPAAAATALQRVAALAEDRAATSWLGPVAMRASVEAEAAGDAAGARRFAAIAEGSAAPARRDEPQGALRGPVRDAAAGDASSWPWRCGACGIAAPARFLACPACGATARCTATEPALTQPLGDVAGALAAIQASPRHQHRLVEAARRGDGAAHDELVRLGAEAIGAICDGFGSEPHASDERLRAVLRAIGAPAVPLLRAALAATPWYERIAFGLMARATNRRLQAIDALAAIGGPAAREALADLAATEHDPALRACLREALARLDGGTGGAG